MQKLQEAGLKLRKDKCVFLGSSVTYLGHQIDAEGLNPIAEKVEALHEFPSRQSVTALKSYLGLLSNYSCFLPNLSTTLALYLLLKDGVHWQWTSDQAAAFDRSNKLIQKSSLLVHFDPTLEIILACDASAYDIEAVLSHRMPDGSEKPVGFASHTLTTAEQNYSQIDKEALACVFGVQSFSPIYMDITSPYRPITNPCWPCSTKTRQFHHKHQAGSNTGPCHWHHLSILSFVETPANMLMQTP